MRRIAATLLAVSFLAACGDDSSADKTPQTTVPEAYLNLVSGLCDAVERCPDALGRPIAYRTKAECAAILSYLFTCRMTETQVGEFESVGLEQVVPNIDEQASQACVDWLKSASCDEINFDTENGNPCSAAFQINDDDDDDQGGEQQVGPYESCYQTSQCQPGLYCAPETYDHENGISYCQVCVARVGLGEPCSVAENCLEAFTCGYDEATNTSKCIEKSNDWEECTTPVNCKSDFCNYTMGREGQGGYGKCDPGGNPGDPCEIFDGVQGPDANCRYENYCDGNVCVARKPLGEPCTGNNQCVIGTCGEGFCGKPDGVECYDRNECSSQMCIQGICGAQAPGQCQSDDACAADEFCAGACEPPDCYCSGTGCQVGTCTKNGTQTGNNDVQTCDDDYQCLSGRCDNGTCAPMPVLGDACDQSYQCYPLGFCSNGVCVEKFSPGKECSGGMDSCKEPFLCVDGRCEIMNLACEPAQAGELCAMFRVCDENSWCDLVGGIRCKPRARLGAPCETSYIPGTQTCEAGAVCQPDESGTTRCVAAPAIGEPCTSFCADGANCVDGVCAAYPAGIACDPYGAAEPCPDGFVCADRRDYICVPPVTAGGQCRESYECAAGLMCDSQTCVDRYSEGQSCQSSEQCREDLYCSRQSYTCAVRLAEGQSCEVTEESCAVGYQCKDGTCTAALQIGEDCEYDSECATGVCYRSIMCAVEAQCRIPTP